MKFAGLEPDEEDDFPLINIKVVEYLEPSMSKELLCKFPDNSAFDFDYSQSSIWSPLVPRSYSAYRDHLRPMPCLMDGVNSENPSAEGLGLKNVTINIKKKIASTATLLNLNKKMMIMKKTKRTHSDFSPTPIKCSTPSKGWCKVLKAASKHFKRKQKDPTLHIKLSKHFRDGNV